MQILSRAAGRRISIGQDITLYIVAINGNNVRLGIEAPRHISVHRAEIYERIKKQLAGRPGHWSAQAALVKELLGYRVLWASVGTAGSRDQKSPPGLCLMHDGPAARGGSALRLFQSGLTYEGYKVCSRYSAISFLP